MSVNLSSSIVPTGGEVDIEIKIHTRLQISSYVAKQKSNVCLVLHCGQNFYVDEPILQVDTRIIWVVPVWLSSSQEGRKTNIGELVVDAQTGEVLDLGERCQTLKHLANALQTSFPAP